MGKAKKKVLRKVLDGQFADLLEFIDLNINMIQDGEDAGTGEAAIANLSHIEGRIYGLFSTLEAHNLTSVAKV